MGEVYRARDTQLEREAAIKVLPQELAEDDDEPVVFHSAADFRDYWPVLRMGSSSTFLVPHRLVDLCSAP